MFNHEIMDDQLLPLLIFKIFIMKYLSSIWILAIIAVVGCEKNGNVVLPQDTQALSALETSYKTAIVYNDSCNIHYNNSAAFNHCDSVFHLNANSFYHQHGNFGQCNNTSNGNSGNNCNGGQSNTNTNHSGCNGYYDMMTDLENMHNRDFH